MRINRVRGAAHSRVYGTQARIKAKVSNKFNKALDAPINKAKGKLAKKKGASQKPSQRGGTSTTPKAAAKDKKGGKMGWFWKKKKRRDEEIPSEEEMGLDEMKTQMISIPEEELFKPCVGWLVIWEGPLKGKDYRLVEGRNRIGRRADLEVVLSDPEVEPEHAHIVFTQDGKYFLSDEASASGTYLNGRRIMETVRIVDNDIIKVGNTVLRFKALY